MAVRSLPSSTLSPLSPLTVTSADISALPNSAFSWTKSSYSGGNGACVELAVPSAEAVAVRDSKLPDGARLMFEGAAWSTFVREVADRY